MQPTHNIDRLLVERGVGEPFAAENLRMDAGDQHLLNRLKMPIRPRHFFSRPNIPKMPKMRPARMTARTAINGLRSMTNPNFVNQ
jgi:hypothetical protein